MIEIEVKQSLDGHNQEKLEEKIRKAIKEFGLKDFHILNESTGNEITETKPAKPDEIKIMDRAVKHYLKKYGNVEITKESFQAFKSWLYKDIHEWLKNNAKTFSENYARK